MKGLLQVRNVWILASAVAVGVVLPAFVTSLRVWGFRIPQPQIELDYLIGVAFGVALGCAILLLPFPTRDKPSLLLIWAAKLVVTLGVMLLYEWQYDLDAFDYYLHFIEPWRTSRLGGGTANLVALLQMLSAVLPQSYHTVKVLFSFAGLMGVYLVYRGAVRAWGREDVRLLLILGFYPSVLFWSSILGKDPIQFLGIGLYVYGVTSWQATRQPHYILPIAVGTLIAASIRMWFAFIMLFPLLIFGFRALRGAVPRLTFAVVTVMVLSATAGRMAADFNLESINDVVGYADQMSRGWEGGSVQVREANFTGLRSMIAFAPFGAFTALYRPLPGEVLNPFGLLAGVENLLLLVLTLLALSRATKQRLSEPLVQWALLFVMTWTAFYAFVSIYNLGAAVRFKLQVIPVLLSLLLYLSRRSEDPAFARAQEGRR